MGYPLGEQLSLIIAFLLMEPERWQSPPLEHCLRIWRTLSQSRIYLPTTFPANILIKPPKEWWTAILNASSCFGRLTSGSLGDRFGHYNTMILSLFLCAISVFALWLPDILGAESTSSPALLITFVILFGFVSGSNVSLTPICLGQLCEITDYGRYYASCYTVVAFGVLFSLPAAGGILDACGDGDEGKRRYWGVGVFTGLSYVVALSCFIWLRIQVKGRNWRSKW
jgi:MFS family permease